jgi:hypothetical protein
MVDKYNYVNYCYHLYSGIKMCLCLKPRIQIIDVFIHWLRINDNNNLHNCIYPPLVLFEYRIDWIIYLFLLYTVTDQDIIFVVPDLC